MFPGKAPAACLVSLDDWYRGVNPGWFGGRDPPQIFGRRGRGGRSQGACGGSWGSWTVRKRLLYLILYRKYMYMYVRKWWLLKRNRIICQEVAVNGQFLPGNSNFFKFPEKSKFFGNLPGKSKFLSEIAWRNRHFSEICLEKLNFFYSDPRPPRFQTRLTPLVCMYVCNWVCRLCIYACMCAFMQQ